MVVAEFLVIGFVVGIVTKTWLGFVGTFFGLYALYRFTRFSAVLSLALSLYWGLLGYHLGVAVGGFGVGPLLAVVSFAVGLGVHRAGFLAVDPRLRPVQSDHFADDAATEERMPRGAAGTFDAAPRGLVIDAEYRVVS